MCFVAEAAALSVNAACDGPEHVLARSLKAGFVHRRVRRGTRRAHRLGGAEFRLPLLIGLSGFLALQAVTLNKAMSLVVVATALAARGRQVTARCGWPAAARAAERPAL